MEDKKTYPPSWVVIQNNIQECFKSMSIDEKRLLVLASPIARVTNATEKDPITITAENFAKECNIKTHSAYKSMEEASKHMLRRYFTYTDEKGKKVSCSWVIRAKYDNGAISICFPEEVLLMLKEFDKLNPYTKYKKEVVLRLKKDYSFDLYHLAKKYQGLGKFELSLDRIKTELGLPKSYDRISNLKTRVLEPSLEEINSQTDLNLTYENIKEGRTVVGFRFKVKEKFEKPKINSSRDTNTLDMFFKMTDGQINMFGNQLAKLPELSHLAVGNESYEALASRIKDMLIDPEKQKKFLPHLRNLGFKG
jgi:plasmid replication initiation protein